MFEEFGKKADQRVDLAKKELAEGKATYNNLDVKEKKWLKIFLYAILAILLIVLLGMCTRSCTKPTSTVINGVTYPLDKNGAPYQQAQNGDGYVPAPGYVNQSQPIQQSGPGFWTGALAGGVIGNLLGRNSAAPAAPQYQPQPVAQYSRNNYVSRPSAPVVPNASMGAKPSTSAPVVTPVSQKVKNPGDMIAIQERAKMDQERAQKAKQEQLKADLRAKQQARSQVKSAPSSSSSSGFKSFSQKSTRRK